MNTKEIARKIRHTLHVIMPVSGRLTRGQLLECISGMGNDTAKHAINQMVKAGFIDIVDDKVVVLEKGVEAALNPNETM